MSQPAEEVALKATSSGFESQRGHVRADEPWTTVVPTPEQAGVVASWSTSAAETTAWVSSATPVTAETVRGWWDSPDVSPRLLLDPTGTPVAYGEVWDDAEEDETELARLIVDPGRRREGVGRRLVAALLDVAGQHGRSACFLRVVPENTAARTLYRAAGFVEVDAATAAEWNAGQPTAYVWMQHQEDAQDPVQLSANPQGEWERGDRSRR